MTNGSETGKSESRGYSSKLAFGIILIVSAVGGIIAAFSLLDAGYREFEVPARVMAMVSAVLGVIATGIIMGKTPLATRLTMLAFATLAFFLPALMLLGGTRDWNTASVSRSQLSQIVSAMLTYQSDNAGYFPFDERGPLQSLALLYPQYIDAPRAFQNPRITSFWSRRNEGPFFPADTALAGSKCHFGYTWRIPANPPYDFAIMAESPDAFASPDLPGVYVAYPDGMVKRQVSPFCSHDPNDNIFAAQPGWQADTDSYVRTSK